MINITFPDGSVRQYESGVSAFDIANSISPRLAADVLAATVIPAADTTGKGSVYDWEKLGKRYIGLLCALFFFLTLCENRKL